MQSGQPGSNNHCDRNQPDIPAAIPDFARAWESAPQVASSVRHPSTLPDPQSYHEVIEPQAIFELDEKQEDGSIETILVVPFGCTRCKLLKQACSRTQPACVRCRKAHSGCGVVQGGYQRLPGPKVGKPWMTRKQSAGATGENSKACSPTPQEPAPGRLRLRRKASGVGSLSQALPSTSGWSIVPGSKRPLSPGSDPVPPRKKTSAKTTSRNRRAHRYTVVASKEMDIECSEVSAVGPSAQVAPAVVSAGEHSALKWTFVNNSRGRGEKSSPGRKHADSIPSNNTPIPRVWTNVRLMQIMFQAFEADIIVYSHSMGF